MGYCHKSLWKAFIDAFRVTLSDALNLHGQTQRNLDITLLSTALKNSGKHNCLLVWIVLFVFASHRRHQWTCTVFTPMQCPTAMWHFRTGTRVMIVISPHLFIPTLNGLPSLEGRLYSMMRRETLLRLFHRHQGDSASSQGASITRAARRRGSSSAPDTQQPSSTAPVRVKSPSEG